MVLRSGSKEGSGISHYTALVGDRLDTYLKYKIGLIGIPIILLLIFGIFGNYIYLCYLIPILVVLAFISVMSKNEVKDISDEQKNIKEEGTKKSPSFQCPKCNSSNVDYGMVEVGSFPQAMWDSGVYFKSTKTSGKIPIKAIRCLDCGHVEFNI